MLQSARDFPPSGADHPVALDRRVDQRLQVPQAGPGPLVEQDDGDTAVEAAVLLPLQAAPMPVRLVSMAGAVTHSAVGQRELVAAANAPSSIVPVAGTACQPGVDLKAFTGKGEPRSVRTAAKAVDDIHARMRELAALTAKLGKNVLYLTVHVRNLTNQHSLRWRGYTVVSGRGRHVHLPWDEAGQRIAQYPYETQVQMRVWDNEARALNEAEQAVRAELKRVRASQS